MMNTAKHWQIANKITAPAEKELHGYPPILRQILFNRGYATHAEARRFLEAKKPPGTEPWALLGLPKAVDRILHALKKQEKIAIYGDYDVDGITSTALLVSYFELLNANISGYIPNRFNEGYGLNIDALNFLENEGFDLILTVDCGIRSLAEAEHAQRLGLDLIITDHHHPGDQLPDATAVIDPKQPGDIYPEKDLAGVGIAYKIIEGLSEKLGDEAPPVEDFLDFVALGTVADLAPLVGENRYMVSQGLHKLRRPQRQGIMSLIGVAGVTPENLSATDIGFALGPRLNAAGRLASADIALELLTTKDVRRAAYLAQQLEVQNRERQTLTRAIQEKAEKLALSQNADPRMLFAVHPEFNPGVVGLAASRLVDRYYRPAIVGHIGEEFTRASCRSISQFHITKALDECADILEYHGGHAAAAGFTVRNENLIELKERLGILADEQLSNIDLRPTISVDVEVSLAELNSDLISHLEWLQPTGYGNPLALFASKGLRVSGSRTVGKDSSHLKMTVSDGYVSFDAIAFRLGHWHGEMPKRVDIVYTFEVNEFRGRETLQLNVKDLRPSGE